MEAWNLKCEGISEPMAIDAHAPRLSWALGGTNSDDRPCAAEVRLAHDPDDLQAEGRLAWCSGRIEPYPVGGIDLPAGQLEPLRRYWWQVRVWSDGPQPWAWSRPAEFWTGLRDGEGWTAQWLGGPGRVPMMRGRFACPGPARFALLLVSARGIVEPWLNGQRVPEARFIPGWSQYEKRLYYAAFEVSGWLQAGENALGLVVAPGWYAGSIGFFNRQRVWGEQPEASAILHVEYEDGTTGRFETGTDWRATESPWRFADLMHGEVYDASGEVPGWSNPDYDDARWAPARLAEPVRVPMQAYPCPPVRPGVPLPARKVSQVRPGSFIFDFGQNFAGTVRLKGHMNAGARLVLRFAEMLNENGTLYLENLRSAQCEDVYLHAGEGTVDYEPRFTFHGFRYAELQGLSRYGMLNPDVPLDTLEGVPLHNDLPATGEFECSLPGINQLMRNIDWSRRSNFLDIPTDCPQRDERLGWTGDVQVFARTALLLCDAAPFLLKWLDALHDAQHANGKLPDFAPDPHTGWGGNAGWGDAAVILPWEIYRFHGDERILRRYWPMIERWIAYLDAHSEDWVRPDEGFGDWLPVGEQTPKDLVSTAYFAHVCDLASTIASIIGLTARAEECAERAGRVRAAFNERFVGEDAVLQGNTQTSYVLALQFDLLEPEWRAKAADHLVHRIEAMGWRLSTGFLGVRHIMEVLTRFGHHDVACRLLINEQMPSWLFPVNQGATTIWERWDSYSQEEGFRDVGMNSFNHYAFGAAGAWLFEVLAGIEPVRPGYTRLLIRPRPGAHLLHARARVLSPLGHVGVQWRWEGDTFLCEVEVPPAAQATLALPLDDGMPALESGRPVTENPSLSVDRYEQDCLWLEAGPGRYRFSCPARRERHDRVAGPRRG